MRIALFHNVPSGGAKRAIYEWVRRLTPDHGVDVYSLTSADHEFCDIRPFVREHHISEYLPRPVFRSPLGRLNQWQRWRDLRDLTQLARNTARCIDRSEYDVVFAHTCQYTHAPLLLQFLQTPTVYYLHEPVGRRVVRSIRRPYLRTNRVRSLLDRFDPLNTLYQSALANAQAKSIARTTRLLANSRYTQEQMERAFAVETLVSYYGVDWETFRPRQDTEKEYSVISVGELTARKGFDFIVEAVGHIPPPKRPKVKIVSNVINEEERAYVQDLARRLDVKLELFINLDSERLAVEYNRALLCVYTPVLEPLGLVPLEAMACELPVVAVVEGGVIDTVIDGFNGRLVPRDPVAFAAAVQELIDDPVQRSHLGRQARERVQSHWSWEKSTTEIEEHLSKTAGGTVKPRGQQH